MDQGAGGDRPIRLPGLGTIMWRGGGRVSMRIAIALLVAALLPLPSFADESELQGMAVRALRWAFYAPNGYRWEYSGILVIRDGRLEYSVSPRTLKQVDAVEMDAEKQRT